MYIKHENTMKIFHCIFNVIFIEFSHIFHLNFTVISVCTNENFKFYQDVKIFMIIIFTCKVPAVNVTLQHSIITHNINIKYIRMMLCVQHARTNYNNNISYSKTSHYNTMSRLTILVTAFTSSPALMKRSTRDVLPPSAA